jgi:hypothetical protein
MHEKLLQLYIYSYPLVTKVKSENSASTTKYITINTKSSTNCKCPPIRFTVSGIVFPWLYKALSVCASNEEKKIYQNIPPRMKIVTALELAHFSM